MGSKKGRSGPEAEGKFYDPMAVTWTEKYNEAITKVWNKIPQSVGQSLVTLATFLVGISISGDWINLYVHIRRQLGLLEIKDISGSHVNFEWSNILAYFRLQGFLFYWVLSCVVSYATYFGIGGFLHWYYYVRQRDRAEEWKIQPNKWLPPELERHEIVLGSVTLFFTASISAVLACYISNGGGTKIYYGFLDYGWIWLFLQFPVLFIYQDYATYWLHRIYHIPFLYKHFHKLHHKYKQPTAFSVTAIHPVEAVHIQLTLSLPLFVIPLHWVSFYGILLYTYYHGIIVHSGINFKSYWWQPWQPDAIFHDNHHQYFHVNFAFNIEIWDKLHGTYRRKDRVYREDTFYGKGKSYTDLSATELKEEIEERASENPLAYRGNTRYFDLSEQEVEQLKKQIKK